MDKHGIEMMILSLNAPAVQAIHDVKTRDRSGAPGQRRAWPPRCANAPIASPPLPRLPMQDPEAATAELTRCVKELGMVGALVNGFSQIGTPDNVTYYDLPQYRPFWRTVEALDVPFYLHPRNPLPSWTRQYEGHSWLLGPNWAFSAETAVHALRLIGSGLFDEHPRLKMVLGHLGEGIPVQLWRIDGRNGWMKAPHKYAAKKGVGHYFRKHFHLTTSGNFHTPSLVNAMTEMGAERVMFSVDWPFEDVGEGAQWFDTAAISEADRQQGRPRQRDQAVQAEAALASRRSRRDFFLALRRRAAAPDRLVGAIAPGIGR